VKLYSKCLLTLVSLSTIALTFYIFVAYRVIFHSDAAMKTLLADEMIRTRRLFPSDWYYVNDIPIIFHHILIAPLLLIFGHPYVVQSVACFAFAILLLGAVYLLFKFSGSSRGDFLVVAAVLLSGVSTNFAEDLFGQAAYGPGVATAVMVVALIFRTARAYAEPDHSLRIWSALLIAVIAVAVASGVRGIFVDVAPSLGALALIIATADRRDEAGPFPRKAAIYVTWLVLLATVLGVAAFLGLSTAVRMRNDSSAPQFIGYSQIGANANLLIQGFLFYSDALPNPAHSPVSIYGTVTAYRLFWFGALISVPFVLLRRYRAIRSPYLRFLIPFYVFGFIATLYLCLFTSLVQGLASFRYFAVSVAFAVLIVGFIASELRVRFGAAAPIWIGLACLPICVSSYQEIFALYFDASVDSGGRTGLHANKRQPLVDYLVNKGLRYGYASYWNAGVLTVLSDRRIRVNAVEFGDNPPVRPFRWLAPAHAYAPDAFQGRTFILMDAQECQSMNKAGVDGYLGPPESVTNVAGYCIMTYSFNVSSRLPGWDERRPSLAANEPYAPGDRNAVMEASVNEITMRDGKASALKMHLRNRGSRVFVSNGKFPFYIGAHLYSSSQLLKNFNYVLTALPGSIGGGETSEIVLPLPAVPDPGEYIVDVSMVQGGVAWFGSKADGQPLRVKLIVEQPSPPASKVRR
jgi:hypothetical protein